MKAKYIYFPPHSESVDVKTQLENTSKKGIRTGLIELNITNKKLRIWIVDKWINLTSLAEENIEKIIKINKWT